MNNRPRDLSTIRWIASATVAACLLGCAHDPPRPATGPEPEQTTDTPRQEAPAAAVSGETEPTAAPAAAPEEEQRDPLAAPADVAAPPSDAQRTASGLAYKVLREGSGTEHPTATSTVEVHYTGWTTDGRMFDSSVARGKKISFPLDRVIRGWTEGVQLMVTGEKTRFWIPANMAYGENPGGGRPGGTLVFDIELFAIM